LNTTSIHVSSLDALTGLLEKEIFTGRELLEMVTVQIGRWKEAANNPHA